MYIYICVCVCVCVLDIIQFNEVCCKSLMREPNLKSILSNELSVQSCMQIFKNHMFLGWK